MGSYWARDQAHVFCFGRWILYHWTFKEAPDLGFFIYIILLFIYFGCAGSSLLLRLFSSCGGGLLFIAVHGFLIAVVSLVAEHRL